ncbi:YceI-like domain-containing protein [Flavobacteriaceae bacterium MAR_2010_72]|nr:YceI-like domain-containing protein [Flavobacteriaceae bacterium MAR_2010_72]TVZ60236.1 YceI-like domain-containing protein [Flavobacteriaceae bacterium MAR_2010_105]
MKRGRLTFVKRFLLVCIGVAMLAFTSAVFEQKASVLIAPNSELLIKGKTNINTFKCKFNINKIVNPIPLYYEIVDDKMLFHEAKLVLANTCFDCGSNVINKDFRELLKTDEYPEISLKLKEIHKLPKSTTSIKAHVQIRIAGKSRTYTVPLEINNDETICASGVLGLNICDFDLVAPKKALGLIVVSEDIEIQFQLNFKALKR